MRTRSPRPTTYAEVADRQSRRGASAGPWSECPTATATGYCPRGRCVLPAHRTTQQSGAAQSYQSLGALGPQIESAARSVCWALCALFAEPSTSQSGPSPSPDHQSPVWRRPPDFCDMWWASVKPVRRCVGVTFVHPPNVMPMHGHGQTCLALNWGDDGGGHAVFTGGHGRQSSPHPSPCQRWTNQQPKHETDVCPGYGINATVRSVVQGGLTGAAPG